MNYVFVISCLTPVGVKSSRTASLPAAFARAAHFPSAIMCWDIEGDEGQVYTASFNNREELNAFFDLVRKGFPVSEVTKHAAKAE